MTTHQCIVQLAEQQLPAAAMLGLGDELAAVDDALHEEERVIRVATAHDGDAFGVLVLTDRRVLWAAAGLAPGTIVLAWPRERVRVASTDDGGPCIEVNDERWQFSRILPADAVDELADQLSDCGTCFPSMGHQLAYHGRVATDPWIWGRVRFRGGL